MCGSGCQGGSSGEFSQFCGYQRHPAAADALTVAALDPTNAALAAAAKTASDAAVAAQNATTPET
jgi:hypothetical protein